MDVTSHDQQRVYVTAPELELKREILGWLMVARSGHCADYHERFDNEEDLLFSFGEKPAQLHTTSI